MKCSTYLRRRNNRHLPIEGLIDQANKGRQATKTTVSDSSRLQFSRTAERLCRESNTSNISPDLPVAHSKGISSSSASRPDCHLEPPHIAWCSSHCIICGAGSSCIRSHARVPRYLCCRGASSSGGAGRSYRNWPPSHTAMCLLWIHLVAVPYGSGDDNDTRLSLPLRPVGLIMNLRSINLITTATMVFPPLCRECRLLCVESPDDLPSHLCTSASILDDGHAVWGKNRRHCRF